MPTGALELVAFATGILSVWLAQRMHRGNWLAGIASVACFAVLFYGAKLYAAALLQLVFVALCAYGWWRWGRDAARALVVTRAPPAEAIAALVAALLATFACAWLLRTRTDSPVPWPDAAVLAFSLLATWWQARGRLDCWWTWIAVDLVAIPLYWTRGLPLTALLFCVFLVLCVAGAASWRRRLLAPSD